MEYNKQSIAQFSVGRVVEHFLTYDVGHVTGVGLNPYNEVLVVVGWANGEEQAIHPTHIIAL